MAQRAIAMDLTSTCLSFPDRLECELMRDNILRDVESALFKENIPVVVVHGSEGIGKTTFLSQFARAHPNDTFSVFIESSAPWAFNPEAVKRDLANQLLWMFEQRELDMDESAADMNLPERWQELGRRARRRHRPYCFVIDGLLEYGKNDRATLRNVLDLIPTVRRFRFLFSGDPSELSSLLPTNLQIQSIRLPSLTKQETASLLDGINLDEHCLHEFHNTCQGMPSNVASVRRVLLGGKLSCHELLHDMSNHLPELFEIEWRQVLKASPQYMQAMTILAQESVRLGLEDLARMTGIPQSDLVAFLSPFTFIRLSPNTQEVAFVSESFRRFAADKLLQYKRVATDLVIADLNANLDTDTALLQLPTYLLQARKFEEVVDFATVPRFAEILRRTESAVSVSKIARLGMAAAEDLIQNADVAKFGLQLSVINQLSSADIWRSEISARMALQDDASAVALARSVLLLEDRLHLLAIIARSKLSQGLAPSQEVDEQIRALYTQIDHKTLGKRASEIAADLVFFDPDMAITMVEKAASVEDDEKALDFALAGLSMVSTMSKMAEQDGGTDPEGIRAKIKNPRLRGFAAAFTPFLRRLNAAHAISEADRIENLGDKFFLLSRWARVNSERADAVKTIDNALDIIRSNTLYIPDAGLILALATPLPFIRESSDSKRLVAIFDAQLEGMQKRGSSEEFVNLQLVLAETESKYDTVAAHDRLVETYIYARGIEDLSSKATCMAHIVSWHLNKQTTSLFKKEEQEALLADLRDDISRLLSGTADHFSMAKDIIEALATTYPRHAISLAENLNTPDRRDQGLAQLIEAMTSDDTYDFDQAILEEALDKISSTYYRDQALITVLEWLAKAPGIARHRFEKVLPLLNRTSSIFDACERCKASCIAYGIVVTCGSDKYSGMAAHLLKQARVSWQSIDSNWSKLDVGYSAAETLAPYSLEAAKEQMQLNQGVQEETYLSSYRSARVYGIVAELAVRAFVGLLPKNADRRTDMEALARAIGVIPSKSYRAQLWGDVATGFALSGRIGECRNLVNQRIRPLLQDIPKDDGGYRTAAIMCAAPALYFARQGSVHSDLSEIAEWYRDEAYNAICTAIAQKHLPWDSFEDSPSQMYDLDSDDLRDLCDLLKYIQRDSVIYHWLELIVEHIVNSRDMISGDQRSIIIGELTRILEKFPSKGYIAHDGYLIAAEAQLARITAPSREMWERLCERARAIPNISDTVYVLGVLGSVMPSRESGLRMKVLREAMALAEQIPSELERIKRLEYLANRTLDIDPTFPRECIALALTSAQARDDEDYLKTQHRLIDLAYKIDPKYASSLGAALDNDPARARIRENMAERLALQQQKVSLFDQISKGQMLQPPTDDNLFQIAWMLLGSLNARRVSTVPMENAYKLIEAASRHPLQKAYPVYAWVLENAKQRWAKTEQAQTHLRSVFEATLQVTELAHLMAQRSDRQIKAARMLSQAVSSDSMIIVHAGERESAIEYLTNWLQRNAREYLKICDPFFGPDELEAIQLLSSVNDVCRVSDVSILTSKKHHDDLGIENLSFAYGSKWRRFSDQSPPHTEVVVVNKYPGGALPLHDRYWITKGAGLRLGTSFRDLGRKRDSEISRLEAAEAQIHEEEIDQYLSRSVRDHGGFRVSYELFEM